MLAPKAHLAPAAAASRSPAAPVLAAQKGFGSKRRARRSKRGAETAEVKTLLGEYSNVKAQPAPAPAPGATPPVPAGAAARGGKTAAPLPPLPGSFKAAGARHQGFESKLTAAKKSQANRSPMAAAAAASIARLVAAADDVSGAEQHIQQLNQLLADSQGTLASLRAPAGGASDEAGLAANAAADRLVGLMSDVLSDISSELELVVSQLGRARADIDTTQSQLEAAAVSQENSGAELAAAVAQASAVAAAANAAAATAEEAAAEAQARAEALTAQLELKEAELCVARQQNEQLQSQLLLLVKDSEQAAEAADSATAALTAAAAAMAPLEDQASDEAAASPTSSHDDSDAETRLRAVLVTQAANNLALLDWLGALAKSVVGLQGVAPEDRLKLASTISKCVLAVGGGNAAGSLLSSSTAAPADA